MISNISAATHSRPASQKNLRASHPAAAPTGPQDSLDFSKIDSPVKAALLPITEPAVQMALAVGFLNALQAAKQAGAGGGVPLIAIDAAIKAGDKLSNVSYQLDLKNGDSPISASGDVAGQPLTDGLTASGQSMHLTGAVGQNATDLALAFNKKNGTLHLDGKLGAVDTHLTYRAIGGAQDFKGIHVDGSLGGVPYSADNLLDMTAASALEPPKDEPAKDPEPPEKPEPRKAPPKGLPPAEPAGAMTVRGKLGTQDIAKDYTLTAQPLSSGAAITFNGKGTTAGVPEDVKVTLNFIA